MARRLALLFLSLGPPAILVCGWCEGFVAELCFILLVMAFPTALIILAVARNGKVGPLLLPLVVLTLNLEAGGCALLFMRGKILDGPWFGGLPGGTAIQIYGLWLGPLFLVAFAYGWAFDRWELRDEDLRRYRERCEQCGRETD